MAAQAKRSGYERDGLDWYVEPRWCVDLLLDHEPFDGLTWDPACGGGVIPEALWERNLQVECSDVVDRGCVGHFDHDFLAVVPPFVPDNILTNPPYRHATEFILRARCIARRKVAVITRLDFLASQRRKPLFDGAARVWVLSKRPSMPPGGFEGPAKGGQHDYCWVVWDRAHRGPCRIGWLAPEARR